MEVGVEAGVEVRGLADRGRPIALARDQVVSVLPPLAGLFPEGGLRRGSTVMVDPGPKAGDGATSLALALMVAASQSGSWCAAVGLADLGPVAAAELGVRLDRLALIPAPGEQWAVVTAALLDAVDLVVVRPPWPPRLTDARRLAARARERGAVLLPFSRAWPSPPGADLRLTVAASAWLGLGEGHGHLQTRAVEVVTSGRGAAARPRRARFWLPGPGGVLAALEERVAASTPPAVASVPKAG